MKEAPEHSKAWLEAVQKLDLASSLDSKTEEIAYIAVLLGMPAVGNRIIQSLPVALNAYDGD